MIKELDLNTKLLIVEDQKSHYEMLEITLQKMGFTNYKWAKDGKEALAMIIGDSAVNEPFEMIVSDINMPEMDGIELLQNIRKHKDPIINKLGFIVTSAVNEQEKVIQAVVSGASDYIIKPIEADVLKQKLFTYFILSHQNKAS